MPIITGTVTVNAAFLQEIKDDNRELRRLLAEVADWFSRPIHDRDALRQLSEGLAELRDQLGLHFSLEEAYGYFEDALDVAPRLSERANILRSEHETLYRDVCELVEQAERQIYRESSARAQESFVLQFLAFRQSLQDHESRENELILESFDEDIGVGD